MKLVVSILSNKDVANVLSATSVKGYPSTKIATRGQFLENGQSTILYGVNEDKLDDLIDLIEKNITKRVIRKAGVESTIEGSLLNKPVDVEEYGAIVFVINVEDFKKL